MKKLVARILIASYHRLPEWLIRDLVFVIIGITLGVGFVFLSVRPNLIRARRVLLRRR